MSTNDGGPAFPHSFTSESFGDCKGMTLRDYFAAKAMQGMLTRPGSVNPAQDAVFAYHVADAMLEARSKE